MYIDIYVYRCVNKMIIGLVLIFFFKIKFIIEKCKGKYFVIDLKYLNIKIICIFVIYM